MALARRSLAIALLAFGLLASIGLVTTASAGAITLNLETLTGSEAEQLLQEGKVNSVELVEMYEARIAALNKAGPGLNAFTQLNPDVMQEAKKADEERKKGINLGPDMGVPIAVKDIIDATPMYTSAGDWALRESFPEKDSGVARNLRAHGLIIMGKLGLSEWANSFGSQPSGFSNLTGQVLNANDAAEGPSGSSSGSGAAAAAGFVPLTIGTETSGSIISPSTAEEDVGLRPTLGLVPGFGIAPIDASQDTAGPIVKTVTDAANVLQSLAEVPGTDPEADEEYEGMMGPHFLENGDILPAPFKTVPDYSSALTLSYVKGKRIGYNSTTCTVVPPAVTCALTTQEEANARAVKALEAAGAILVEDKTTTVASIPSLPSGYEAHATIDEYYKHLGSKVPVHSLAEEVAVDNTNPQEAEKDGNSAHQSESEAEDTPGGTNQKAYETELPIRKKAYHEAIEKMMNEPSGGGAPVIAVVGSVPDGPQAGLPEMVVPMGYSPTQRRPLGVDINGGAYDELNILGVGYVVEQGTKLRQSPAMVDPSMYRCAHTVPAEPFASRGHCNPDSVSVSDKIGKATKLLSISLETTSMSTLEEMLKAKTLTSKQLVEAELYRVGLTNSDGPAIQAIRAINAEAIEEAEEIDEMRAHGDPLGPLAGIPVVVDDSINIAGLATSAGSIALENSMPASDATVVKKLKAAGAIVLGDTNTSELGGLFETSSIMPAGYSSLGGQVLLASDTNKSVGGSSGGSADAVSVGDVSLAIGMETSTTEGAQMIAPASNAGVVALKPTVGLVSRAGTLPDAKSQDSVGPIGMTVRDVATALGVLAGPDTSDPATSSQPSPLPSYTAGLTRLALSGKKIAVISSTTAPYPEAVAELTVMGATSNVVTPGTGTTAPSVVQYEFHSDLNAYLSDSSEFAKGSEGAKSLAEIIAYDEANPVEGLKYGQGGLLAAEAVNVNEAAAKTAYEANLKKGREEDQETINGILKANGDAAIMVPSGNALVGIADRAGYPVLTVPAGFGAKNSSTGGDPIGVDLIGTAYSEAELLDYGYALEQGLKARSLGPAFMESTVFPNLGLSGAPSETNQSMFRCVLGSSFFKPYDCNPFGSSTVPTGVSHTISGSSHGPLTVKSGEFVEITSTGSVSGPVTVEAGGELEADPGSSISGPTRVNGAAFLRLCGASLSGPVEVVNDTDEVVIGGSERCGNAISGPVAVTGNKGGTTVTYNTIHGPLTVSGNAAPVEDEPNMSSGKGH